MNRRHFLSLAGTAAGATALGAYGISSGWGKNEPSIQFDKESNITVHTDVLVIGSGMAGVFAAVKAHDAGAKVMMVSKGRLGSSGQTPFAKGIFAFDPSQTDVTLDEFTDSVSRSALGTNNPVYTRQMAEHSLARVNELKDWGFFDSPLYNKSFIKPMKERDIQLAERIVVTHLIKENNRIAGAAGFSLDDKKAHIFNAKSVILCTGAGGFKPNGFPICDLTHDGTAMAYNIGAKVTGKEWNDGHFAQKENPAACFDGWHDMFEKKPCITSVEIHHDLGVEANYAAYVNGSSAISKAPSMNRPEKGGPKMGGPAEVVGGPYVPEEFSRKMSGPPGGERPDGPPKNSKRKGNDSGPPPMMGQGSQVGGASAGMSIHKSEGLVPINDKCESNIPGLYAAGDALGSYMAGAIYTQIGSSLSGSAVQGAIAGENAALYAADVETPAIPSNKLKNIQEEIFAPLNREAGYSPAWITQTLQGIMIPNFVLYIKKESMLKAALAYIEELRDHHIPMLRAADMHELRLAHETTNMITNAEMKLKASLMRKESRCSHYRLDYPEMDNENWQAWINIYKGNDGEMTLEKQDFKAWPKQN